MTILPGLFCAPLKHVKLTFGITKIIKKLQIKKVSSHNLFILLKIQFQTKLKLVLSYYKLVPAYHLILVLSFLTFCYLTTSRSLQ